MSLLKVKFYSLILLPLILIGEVGAVFAQPRLAVTYDKIEKKSTEETFLYLVDLFSQISHKGWELDITPPSYDLINPFSLKGLALPTASSLQLNPSFLPNSPRSYRNGIHEGIDFPVSCGAQVKSIYYGVVSRITNDFQEPTPMEFQLLLEKTLGLPNTPLDVLDTLRGKQVWIDHGCGVSSRYAHLSSFASELKVGQKVQRGQSIGQVGRSGITNTNFGCHLHLEVRIGENYLGEGLSYNEMVTVLQKAFSL